VFFFMGVMTETTRLRRLQNRSDDSGTGGRIVRPVELPERALLVGTFASPTKSCTIITSHATFIETILFIGKSLVP